MITWIKNKFFPPPPFDPIRDKWSITWRESLEKYGTALNVLEELEKDNVIGLNPLEIMNRKAILELKNMITQKENEHE